MSRRAFTLLELLVSIGIVALLASLVVVALSGVSNGAKRAQSLNALRSMMTGYTSYSSDHKQRLLPGYVSSDTLENVLGIQPKYADGSLVDFDDAQSYVWRLAPYLDDNWQTVITDYQSQQFLSAVTNGPVLDRTRIGREPSFGINSLYVGGDDVNGDVTRNPWYPDDPAKVQAATRLSEVKNPARLFVFIAVNETVGLPDSKPLQGRPVVLPPEEWTVNEWKDAERIIDGGDGTSGVPVARWGALVPVAHLDGSTVALDEGQMVNEWNWDPDRLKPAN